MPLPAFVIPAITAGASAIGNMFSGNSDNTEEILQRYIKNYHHFDESKAIGDLARMTNSRRKSRRAGIEAKNSQLGLSNPTDVYSNEEDLTNAEVQGLSDISGIKQQDTANFNQGKLAIEMGRQPEESTFSKGLFGALAGADMGLNIQSLITKAGIEPGSATGGGEDNPVKKPEKEKQYNDFLDNSNYSEEEKRRLEMARSIYGAGPGGLNLRFN